MQSVFLSVILYYRALVPAESEEETVTSSSLNNLLFS